MKQQTWKSLKPVVQRLGVLRIRRICKQVFGRQVYDDSDLVSIGEHAVLVMATTLQVKNIISEDQQDLLLDEMGKKVQEECDSIFENKVGNKLNAAVLSIVDRQFARLSGQSKFLDLKTGNYIQKLDLAPIEIIVFDLVALVYRTMKLADSLHTGTNKNVEASDRNTSTQNH